MLLNFEKSDGEAVLGGPSSFPTTHKDPKSDVASSQITSPVRSYEAIFQSTLDAAREQRPDLWAAFQAEEWRKAKDPVASKKALLLELVTIGEKILSDQVKAEYAPSSPQQQVATAAPMDQDSFLIHNGVPFMSLTDAARHAGVHRETLLTWMKNQTKFDGEPIEAMYFKPTGNHFISKRSVEKIVNRFEWWPSEQTRPHGITIGKTEQGTGYLPISDAARVIGIADVTLRKWVRQGKAPSLERPLYAVRDTSSGYFYIEQDDVRILAEHVKKSGLPRGGRPQTPPVPL